MQGVKALCFVAYGLSVELNFHEVLNAKCRRFFKRHLWSDDRRFSFRQPFMRSKQSEVSTKFRRAYVRR